MSRVEKTNEPGRIRIRSEINRFANLQQWIEIDARAYRHNLRAFRHLIDRSVKLMAVVKSNAYGHGAAPITQLAVNEGIDYLGVHCLNELKQINDIRGETPVVLLGPSLASDAEEIIDLGIEPTLSSLDVARAVAVAARASGKRVPIHIKIETGTHRQGILPDEIPNWCDLLREHPSLQLRGIHTHFANIEDTTDHTIAKKQLSNLHAAHTRFTELGQPPEIIHSACSAAAIVMPETCGGMIRLGISGYGLWPSRETYLSTLLSQTMGPELIPVLSWHTRITQIKCVGVGEYIGYGCSFRTTHSMRLAVLPIGYYDGYDRRLSARAYTLVRGKRAPVVGRVCMNMLMIDISDIPAAQLGEVATLIGSGRACDPGGAASSGTSDKPGGAAGSGDSNNPGADTVSADHLATICGTINYEIVSRLGSHIPRIVTGDDAVPEAL